MRTKEKELKSPPRPPKKRNCTISKSLDPLDKIDLNFFLEGGWMSEVGRRTFPSVHVNYYFSVSSVFTSLNLNFINSIFRIHSENGTTANDTAPPAGFG